MTESFEEQFPSLDGYGQLGFIIGDVSVKDMIKKHCLDKEKVRQAIEDICDKQDIMKLKKRLGL